jgi:hypothetical protein
LAGWCAAAFFAFRPRRRPSPPSSWASELAVASSITIGHRGTSVAEQPPTARFLGYFGRGMINASET